MATILNVDSVTVLYESTMQFKGVDLFGDQGMCPHQCQMTMI